MKSLARLIVCAAALVLPACLPIALFEDVGSDPHPPSISLVGVALQPEPLPAEEGEEPVTPPPVFAPPEQIVVRPNDQVADTLLVRLAFADVGGDITSFVLRDRDGVLDLSQGPAAPEVDIDGDGIPDVIDVPGFFTGTSGIVDFVDIVFPAKLQEGPHRIEIWAEDSHGSRSAKVEFTVTVDL